MGSTGVDGRGGRLTRDGPLVYGANREITQWVAGQIPGFHVNPNATAIGVIKGGELVAGFVYERWNGINIEASIGAKPGSRWADRRTLHALFAYPFLQLGCETITAIVAASNARSLAFTSKLGLEGEAIVRFAAHDGSDLIVFKQYRDKCRWI